MSWLGWGAAVNPQYEEMVEKACSPLNLPYPQSEDIANSLEITDMIRSKAVQPKQAMQSLKKRISSPNGRVQMYALGLIDTCIKNGGDHFLAEIASKEFVDEMQRLIKLPNVTGEIRQMALGYFQAWAIVFRGRPDLRYLSDVYDDLKNSGTKFPPPPAQTSSHLIATTTAPSWVDSETCMRCRSAFTFTNRKHHCRNCGLIYDQACSSKSLPLPHFGITTPVRVCDSCYAKGGKPIKAAPPPAVPTGRTQRSRADFDADLQRAIELSLADSSSTGAYIGSEPPLSKANRSTEDDDEELRLAIEASLRDMERERPSAPNGYDEPEFKPLPTFDLNPGETERILTFCSQVDNLTDFGVRDLHRYPHMHNLADQAYGIGGKLHRNIEEKSTKQQMLLEMQDKIAQAVSLYGSILDGQQAYAAQQLQERQQRQYAQQQSQYNQYQPAYQSYGAYTPQGYHATPPPQPNGYAAYAPPQATYSPAPAAQHAPAPAASSLYPAMPSQPQAYTPQPYAAPYSQQSQPQQYAPPVPAIGGPAGYPTSGPSYTPRQPSLERQSSVRSVSSATPIPAQRPTPQRQTSMSYSSAPTQPDRTPQVYQDPSGPSAPPVDMSSHPSASPRSLKTQLPALARSVSGSYTSPVAAQNYPLPASPIAAPPGGGAAQQWVQPSQVNNQPQHQQQQQQPQPQQNVYYDTSFPAAPPAVFPDAPSSEPSGQEKVEQKKVEEALLIEL